MIEIREKEVYRYLGYRGITPDPAISRRIESVTEELQKTAVPKHAVIRVPVQVSGAVGDAVSNASPGSSQAPSAVEGESPVVRLGSLTIPSAALARNMAHCREAFIFAATIGHEVDRLTRRYEIRSMLDAAICQATAAAMIESYVDSLNMDLVNQVKEEGLYLKPRFSPGYGDCPLEIQKDVLAILDAGRQTGITLTDGFLMVPTKSVTAFIGITEDYQPNHAKDCNFCDKTDCEYRLI